MIPGEVFFHAGKWHSCTSMGCRRRCVIRERVLVCTQSHGVGMNHSSYGTEYKYITISEVTVLWASGILQLRTIKREESLPQSYELSDVHAVWIQFIMVMYHNETSHSPLLSRCVRRCLSGSSSSTASYSNQTAKTLDHYYSDKKNFSIRFAIYIIYCIIVIWKKKLIYYNRNIFVLIF